MADSNSSLDDFFAKKDKRRTKKTFSSADEIAKQLEDNGKEIKLKKDKDKTNQAYNSSSFKILNQNDDEWAEFSHEKDYSGLRVQPLNFREKEEEEREQQKVQEIEDSKREESGSAWKVQANEESNDNSDGESKKIVNDKVEPPAETTIAKPSTYVPPHLRDKKPSMGLSPGYRSRMKNAPEINNVSEFPSLGNESVDTEFKFVKHGSKAVSAADHSSINVGNKFNVLTNESDSK